ncbi:unnamed protein product [Moneuplotes crassus]|uniref:Uncharacterized protein n=1 Tax=Euplotes crassus TaxID=5936 RepID=A0AAD1XLM6_EUPCR|nr:unnamed protein product [Moneuplotes crassus]
MGDKGNIKGCKTYVILLIIYSCLGFITLLVHLCYSVKFFRMFRFKHKLTSVFMIFLTLSIICDFIYGVSEVCLRFVDTCNGNGHYCTSYWTSWINYFMYMSTIIVLSFVYISQTLRFKDRGRRTQRIYDIILWTTMFVILVICTAVFIVDGVKECIKTDPDEHKPITIGIKIISCIYMVTGIFFMITLIWFYRALKKVETNTNGVKLYKKLKCRLAVSITVIFVVFATRSGFTLVRSFNDFTAGWKEKSMEKDKFDYALYIFCYYFFLSLVPAIVQIYLIKLSLSSNSRVTIKLKEYNFETESWLSSNHQVLRSCISGSGQTESLIEHDNNTSLG